MYIQIGGESREVYSGGRGINGIDSSGRGIKRNIIGLEGNQAKYIPVGGKSKEIFSVGSGIRESILMCEGNQGKYFQVGGE